MTLGILLIPVTTPSPSCRRVHGANGAPAQSQLYPTPATLPPQRVVSTHESLGLGCQPAQIHILLQLDNHPARFWPEWIPRNSEHIRVGETQDRRGPTSEVLRVRPRVSHQRFQHLALECRQGDLYLGRVLVLSEPLRAELTREPILEYDVL